jgi:hypothetical protein
VDASRRNWRLIAGVFLAHPEVATSIADALDASA